MAQRSLYKVVRVTFNPLGWLAACVLCADCGEYTLLGISLTTREQLGLGSEADWVIRQGKQAAGSLMI